MTYLVNHIGQHTLNLIWIDQVTAAHTNSSLKLGNGNSCTTDRGGVTIFWLIKSTSDKDLTKEVTQGDISTSFKGKINTSLDKFSFAMLQSLVKGLKVAGFNASSKREEEVLQSRVILEEGFRREDVAGKETARNEVGEDSSVIKSANIFELQWLVLTPIARKRLYGTVAMLR